MAACRVLGRGFIAKKAVEVLLSRCRTARCPGRGHFCHLSQHHPTASHVQPPSYAFWVSHMLGPPTEKNSGESGEVLAFINRQNLAKSSRTFSFIPLWRAGTVSPFRERFRIYMGKRDTGGWGTRLTKSFEREVTRLGLWRSCECGKPLGLPWVSGLNARYPRRGFEW